MDWKQYTLCGRRALYSHYHEVDTEFRIENSFKLLYKLHVLDDIKIREKKKNPFLSTAVSAILIFFLVDRK